MRATIGERHANGNYHTHGGVKYGNFGNPDESGLVAQWSGMRGPESYVSTNFKTAQ